MKFRHTIIYVEDVKATLNWYKDTFGFAIKFLHDSNMYGELATGETLLSFASFAMAEMNLPGGYVAGNGPKPLGFEIALITEDVGGAVDKAVEAGAALISIPEEKPWGQTVGYVRAPDGTVIEFGSPMDPQD